MSKAKVVLRFDVFPGEKFDLELLCKEQDITKIEFLRKSMRKMTNMKLIRKEGKECGLPQLNEAQFCPHCGKMICPEIITLHFWCNYCHYCGGKVEY